MHIFANFEQKYVYIVIKYPTKIILSIDKISAYIEKTFLSNYFLDL